MNLYTQIHAKDTEAKLKIKIEKSNSVSETTALFSANYLVGSLIWNNYAPKLYLKLLEHEDQIFLSQRRKRRNLMEDYQKKPPTFALFIDLQLLNMCSKVTGIALGMDLAQRKPFCT